MILKCTVCGAAVYSDNDQPAFPYWHGWWADDARTQVTGHYFEVAAPPSVELGSRRFKDGSGPGPKGDVEPRASIDLAPQV